MDHQDWNPVTIRSSARIAANATKREIQPKRSGEAQHLAKLEKEDYVKPKLLAPESRQELVKRRLELKMTQQQLDQQCAVPPHTVRDLESNKRAPSSKELQTLNRVLKVGLKLA